MLGPRRRSAADEKIPTLPLSLQPSKRLKLDHENEMRLRIRELKAFNRELLQHFPKNPLSKTMCDTCLCAKDRCRCKNAEEFVLKVIDKLGESLLNHAYDDGSGLNLELRGEIGINALQMHESLKARSRSAEHWKRMHNILQHAYKRVATYKEQIPNLLGEHITTTALVRIITSYIPSFCSAEFISTFVC